MPLRDMLSLGAWRMGLGCSGKILPSPQPSSPSPSTLGLSLQIGLIEGGFGGAKPPQQPSTLGLSFQIGSIYAKCQFYVFVTKGLKLKRWGAVRHVIVSGISMRIYLVSKKYCRSEGLPSRDMLSLGAWRMGLGCSGKILPPPPPPSPSTSPGWFIIWLVHNMAGS